MYFLVSSVLFDDKGEFSSHLLDKQSCLLHSVPIAYRVFVCLKRCLKQWLQGGSEFVDVVLGQGRFLLFFWSLSGPAKLDAMREAGSPEGLGCAALSRLAQPTWENTAGWVTGQGLSWGSINSISVCVMKSGSRGLLQHSAGRFQGLSFRGKAEFNNPWSAPARAALPSSNGLLLIIWGCFVCVARALLFRQLAGNGDEGSLNSLLIKDQWLYCEKIEYRCKLYLIKELNVSLTFLFCFFSATGAWPSFLRLLSFLVVLHFKDLLRLQKQTLLVFFISSAYQIPQILQNI